MIHIELSIFFLLSIIWLLTVLCITVYVGIELEADGVSSRKIGIVVIAIIGTAIALDVLAWAAFVPKEISTVEKEEILSTRQIISLRIDKSIDGEGNFRKGSGSFVIESSDEYTFYYKDKKTGAIKRDGVPVESSEIYFDDNKEPRVEKVSVKKVDLYEHRLGKDESVVTDEEILYRIYIPSTSVVNPYEI